MGNPKPLNLTYQGITMNINKWATYAGMHRGTLRTRLMSWRSEDMFSGTRLEGKELNVEEIKETLAKRSYDIQMAKRPICSICKKPVKNYTGNNQIYCRYTEKQKEELKENLTPCQKTAKSKVKRGWQNRLGRGEGPKNIDSVESYKAVKPLERKSEVKERRCIGLLTDEDELGPHTFISNGPHHRVCDKCHEAIELRVIYDRPLARVDFLH